MKIGHTYTYIGPGVGHKGFEDGKSYCHIQDGQIYPYGDGSGGKDCHYFEECKTEKTKELSAGELYSQMQKLSGLKVGDKVKILRSYKEDEMGAYCCFTPSMREEVGQEGVITAIFSRGVKVNGWLWPFFVLEKLEEPPVEVKLNSEYTAIVAGDRETVKVGCQTFSREAVLELAEKLKK
jgi:hypothetical protein